MKIFTIGFTRRTAESFFETLRSNEIRRMIDVRLNNSSQLAGFTKKEDLRYFLSEICGADYHHEPLLAPTQEILDSVKKQGVKWSDFERSFMALMEERRPDARLDRELFGVPVALLCSEASPEHCHRRLVAEYLRDTWGGVEIIHL